MPQAGSPPLLWPAGRLRGSTWLRRRLCLATCHSSMGPVGARSRCQKWQGLAVRKHWMLWLAVHVPTRGCPLWVYGLSVRNPGRLALIRQCRLRPLMLVVRRHAFGAGLQVSACSFAFFQRRNTTRSLLSKVRRADPVGIQPLSGSVLRLMVLPRALTIHQVGRRNNASLPQLVGWPQRTTPPPRCSQHSRRPGPAQVLKPPTPRRRLGPYHRRKSFSIGRKADPKHPKLLPPCLTRVPAAAAQRPDLGCTILATTCSS